MKIFAYSFIYFSLDDISIGDTDLAAELWNIEHFSGAF